MSMNYIVFMGIEMFNSLFPVIKNRNNEMKLTMDHKTLCAPSFTV